MTEDDITEPVPDPAVVQKNPVNPYKLAMLFSILVTCVGIAITGNSPITLQETLGTTEQFVFAGAGILSSACVLLGLFWKDRRDGLLIEIPGLVLLGAFLLTYGAAVYITVENVFASLAAPLAVALGVANFVRVWQIVREFRRADKAVTQDERNERLSHQADLAADTLDDLREERGNDDGI